MHVGFEILSLRPPPRRCFRRRSATSILHFSNSSYLVGVRLLAMSQSPSHSHSQSRLTLILILILNLNMLSQSPHQSHCCQVLFSVSIFIPISKSQATVCLLCSVSCSSRFSFSYSPLPPKVCNEGDVELQPHSHPRSQSHSQSHSYLMLVVDLHLIVSIPFLLSSP